MKKLIALLLTAVLICVSATTFAAPKKDLWVRWQVFNPFSQKTINYKDWALFLNHNVSTNQAGVNLVDYKTVTQKDRQLLNDFILYLSQTKIDNYSRRVQEAYWINLYNALTVKTVLDHYPVKSILKISISPGLFTDGPWDKKLVQVEGVNLTLNDIEHRILRPIWNDPRIHFTVNCASYSCPNLRKIPYSGQNIGSLLNLAAAQYINNPRGVSIKSGKLTVSSIFFWYKADFGGTDQDVIHFMMLYAKPDLKSKLQKFKSISGNYYNWNLNAASS